MSVPTRNYTGALSDMFPVVSKNRLIESGIESRDVISVLPSNATTAQAIADNFIEFRLQGIRGYLYDLASMVLEVKGTVVKEDGTALHATNETVILTDNTLNSLFSSISVSLNGKQIENSPLYPITSYIRIVTESSPAKLDGVLANLGYRGNASDYKEISNAESIPESAKADSSKHTSKQLQYVGPLFLDLNTIDGLLFFTRISHFASLCITLQHNDAISLSRT